MYDVFVIDPPWQKKKGGLRKSRPNQGRDLDYPTMPTGDIFALLDTDILSMAADTHCVFLWTIEQYLTECDTEMFRRGYRRHARLIWNKLNGVAPAFTVRYSHEYLVWYYKPRLLPIAQEMRGKIMTVFEERGREHSRKPDIAYNIISALYPESHRIDVFSREKRKGWEQWGNQVDYFEQDSMI